MYAIKKGIFDVRLEHNFHDDVNHRLGPSLISSDIYVVNRKTGEKSHVGNVSFIGQIVRKAQVNSIPIGCFIHLDTGKRFDSLKKTSMH